METIFSRIAKREIPCYFIAEDENYFAFLDINPLQEGHTLVIPKKPVDYIYDLDDALLSGLHLFAKRVAAAIEIVVDCKRIGVVVLGLEVPHAHIHLVPLKREEDVDFKKKKLTFSTEEFTELAAKIAANFK